MIDIHHSARRALSDTAEWIDQFGGRLAGSAACRAMAERLCAELEAACGTARLETFQTHPAAFMNFHKISFTVYVISTLLLLNRQPFLAALGFLYVNISGFLEFGLYRELLDPLFPRATCANVWASLEPQGEPRQQVILSGHHDSAQELTFLRRWQKLYAFRIILPDAFQFLAMIYAFYWSGWRLVTGGDAPYWFLPTALVVLGGFLFAPKFFLVGPRATPGAGDNLIASAAVVELARRLAAGGGKSHLAHTRVIFASFDAEESGLRGSRAFAKCHREMIQALPTFMLNIDSIYNVRELQFLVNDLNGYQPLSQAVVDECLIIARDAGYPARPLKMVFGGGATDACELAKVGAAATTLIAMPTGLIRDGLAYHTMNDTVEAIEPEAVEAVLKIAWEWVQLKDRTGPDC